MVRRCLRFVSMLVLCICSAERVVADNDWPNWRGPHYNGSAENATPPTEWSGSKNVYWKVEVPGKGSSSPIVWGDQTILLTAIPAGSEQASSADAAQPGRAARKGAPKGSGRPAEQAFSVISYRLADGKELWRTTVNKSVPHEGGHPTNTFASSSAVTDGKHIFVSYGSRGIYCLDMAGLIVWSKQLGQMQTRNQFGEGSSPALVNGSLIVPWDHEGPSAIYALDAGTGEIRWKADRDEPTTWATPLAVDYRGRTQIVTNGTTARSYDLETGTLVWACGGQVSNPIPSPIRFQDDAICMTGFRGNSIYSIPLSAQGDISGSEKIHWQNHDAAPYIASPVLYKGRVYLTKERTGIMTSLDAATGKVIIPPTRLSKIQTVYASPVAAADRIYFTDRDGTTVVIRHSDKLEELAINSLGEGVDASPALVGDKLLIRGAKHLYCLK